jgi:hypothetical protein
VLRLVGGRCVIRPHIRELLQPLSLSASAARDFQIERKAQGVMAEHVFQYVVPAMSGQVAIVTGASRGIGRGVAVGLGEAGWTVYVTARTVREGESDRPGSITKTAEQVTRAGGRGIPMRSDHSVDSETEAVFRRVAVEQGGLDLLVNNATSYSTDLGPRDDAMFWDTRTERSLRTQGSASEESPTNLSTACRVEK